MSKGNKESESYGEVCDKITRVVKYMTDRDGKEPSFQEFFVEIIKSRDLPSSNLEFIIPRYAEVWRDLVGYTDDHKFMLDGLRLSESVKKKKKTKKRQPIFRNIMNFIKKRKLKPVVDKALINKLLLQIILFVLICFYYEWITNIGHHMDLFFGVEGDSFLGIIARVFWLVTCVSSGLFLGFKTFKGLSKINNFSKKISLTYRDIEEHLFSIFNNRIGKLMLGLFVVFFLFFSSSSKYYNNYIGLKLENIVEDEYTISGEEFLEYYETGQDVPDEIVYEILDEFDNNLFKKEKETFINNRLDVFGEYYEYIGFNSEKFIFKETGAFQGYSTYSLKDGFLPYLKCLFFSLLETTYRAILFFLIIGTPLLLLVLKCSDEQLGKLIQYGGAILFATILLWFIYYLGKELFEWIKSFFN